MAAQSLEILYFLGADIISGLPGTYRNTHLKKSYILNLTAMFIQAAPFRNTFFFLIVMLSLGIFTACHNKVRNLVKEAATLQAQGKVAEAAAQYEAAYLAGKKKRPELMHEAAKAYYSIRDYEKAANAFQALQNLPEYPVAGLMYARCLKSSGQPREAALVLREMKPAPGPEQEHLEKLIANELKGATRFSSRGDANASEFQISNLSTNINSTNSEYAPLAFGEDVLYFTGNRNGKPAMLRTQRTAGNWSVAVAPNFPEMPAGNLLNGTFSPDQQRFYFSICQGEGQFGGVQAKCDLYVIQKQGSKGWSAPQKLRDYIKGDGTTITQPCVIFDGDQEVLYFVSDRKGGQGGMDIWVTSRELYSPDFDFTLPRNAGPTINTPGDEISPAYMQEEHVLYFASNGLPGLGGFDLFKAPGSVDRFGAADHMGFPFNSEAEDYQLSWNKGGNTGYLVSNRKFGAEKLTTTHDDIYFVEIPVKELLLSGQVLEGGSSFMLEDAEVTLYEVAENGKLSLLKQISTKKEAFRFPLLPDTRYKLLARKKGFEDASVLFNTLQAKPGLQLEQNLELHKMKPEIPVVKASTTTTPSRKTTAPTKPATKTKATEKTTSVGMTWRVQLTVLSKFDGSTENYEEAVGGTGAGVKTETIAGKGWTRIMAGDFSDASAAEKAMSLLKASGYPSAFLVKYKDGKRLTP